jgi:hypothetical protein
MESPTTNTSSEPTPKQPKFDESVLKSVIEKAKHITTALEKMPSQFDPETRRQQLKRLKLPHPDVPASDEFFDCHFTFNNDVIVNFPKDKRIWPITGAYVAANLNRFRSTDHLYQSELRTRVAALVTLMGSSLWQLRVGGPRSLTCCVSLLAGGYLFDSSVYLNWQQFVALKDATKLLAQQKNFEPIGLVVSDVSPFARLAISTGLWRSGYKMKFELNLTDRDKVVFSPLLNFNSNNSQNERYEIILDE